MVAGCHETLRGLANRGGFHGTSYLELAPLNAIPLGDSYPASPEHRRLVGVDLKGHMEDAAVPL